MFFSGVVINQAGAGRFSLTDHVVSGTCRDSAANIWIGPFTTQVLCSYLNDVSSSCKPVRRRPTKLWPPGAHTCTARYPDDHFTSGCVYLGTWRCHSDASVVAILIGRFVFFKVEKLHPIVPDPKQRPTIRRWPTDVLYIRPP